MSNHELTHIFYDGLGLQDRYLLDAASGSTFMRKFEDEGMELIETVAENSHHNAAKPFGRGETSKGGLIDEKSKEVHTLCMRKYTCRVPLKEFLKLFKCLASRIIHIRLMNDLGYAQLSNPNRSLTYRFRASLKHKNIGQK